MITGNWTAQRDARVILDMLPPKRPNFQRYAGIDFGESCGLALADLEPGQLLKDVTVYMELIDLSIGTFDSQAVRFLRFERILECLSIDVLGYEDVKYTPSQDMFTGKVSVAQVLQRSARPTEFFGGLKYFTTTWAERNGIAAKGWGIGEIKKYATGKGNASKSDMIAACNKLLGTNFDPEDKTSGVDDLADSGFVLCMTAEHFNKKAA